MFFEKTEQFITVGYKKGGACGHYMKIQSHWTCEIGKFDQTDKEFTMARTKQIARNPIIQSADVNGENQDNSSILTIVAK